MDIGQIIATRYRIDRVIGHGGMGDIYLGTDLIENRDVAIKRLKRELVQSDPDVVERFLREGDIQQRLSHPAIVQVYETIQDDDEYFIVMEYVNGGTLSTLMKRQPRFQPAAVFICRRAAREMACGAAVRFAR